MASITNFINNNFIGGRVYLTIVNVLGSWLGNVIPPGMSKDLAQDDPSELVEEEPVVIGGIGPDEDVDDDEPTVRPRRRRVVYVLSEETTEEEAGLGAGIWGGSGVEFGEAVENEVLNPVVDAVTELAAPAKRLIRVNLAPMILALGLFSFIFGLRRFGPVIYTGIKQRLVLPSWSRMARLLFLILAFLRI